MQLNTDNGGGDRGFALPSVRREYTSLKALTLSFSHFALLCSPARALSRAEGSRLVRPEAGRRAESAVAVRRVAPPPAAVSANPVSPRVIERAPPPAQAEDERK